jgi:AbrB family looped-hinge helix DNA binding protein
MHTSTLSTKGQLVIPQRYRQALRLHPGDKVALALDGEKLVLSREISTKARLVKERGRKVLVAPLGVPPMTTASVKAALADFP